MTTPAGVGHLAKIIRISIAAMAAIGLSNCAPQSEFERENGFSRNDYFGNFGAGVGFNYVPREVQKPEYYTPVSRTRIGHPSKTQRPALTGPPKM